MDPLTWTGSLGTALNPLFLAASAIFIASTLAYVVASFVSPVPQVRAINETTAIAGNGTTAILGRISLVSLLVIVIFAIIYVMGGIVSPYGAAGIVGEIGERFLPVWIALIITFALSITFKRKLGLYGKLFDSPIGMVGFGLTSFWVFTAIFAGAFDMIITHEALVQESGMKNKVPGTPLRGAAEGEFPHYLLGGDTLARDVFSRMVSGSITVLLIAPAATAFAFMVGITLGLPAGYYSGPALTWRGMASVVFALVHICLSILLFLMHDFLTAAALSVIGWLLLLLMHYVSLDTVLSFIANLVLAFPVILLFFLLVTPEIRSYEMFSVFGKGITFPRAMAAVLFLFPVIFLLVLWQSRYFTQPAKRNLFVGLTVLIGGWLYLGLAWDADPMGRISMDAGVLIVFVSVVFVNAPTVFRIVRGLVLDIKTRDYVAAGQTRGEGPWYIMLWEILPNARGPLIVDFCLRIGYTTILLGTLGFFGLGLSPESPDWGTTINQGRRLLSVYPHPAIAPALSLMSLVLGLNLLADGLREESLRD